MVDPGWRKQAAAVLGIARGRLYYTPTVHAERDMLAVRELLSVHEEHPRYGVRRLAAELGWSQTKARRIRTLAGVTIAKRSRKYGKRTAPEIQAPQNALKQYAVFRDEPSREPEWITAAWSMPALGCRISPTCGLTDSTTTWRSCWISKPGGCSAGSLGSATLAT